MAGAKRTIARILRPVTRSSKLETPDAAAPRLVPALVHATSARHAKHQSCSAALPAVPRPHPREIHASVKTIAPQAIPGSTIRFGIPLLKYIASLRHPRGHHANALL